MKKRLVFSSCAAVMFSFGVAAAQVQPQTPTQSPVQGNTQEAPEQTRPTTGAPNTQSAATSTWTGCVMRASDYTKAHAGANVSGSEFVLSNAAPAAGARASADVGTTRGEIAGGVSGSTSAPRDTAAVGTSGTAKAGTAYGLTAMKGAELAPHVGKRVEIVGMMEHSGSATAPAGATASPSPSAQAAAMQKITISSVRVVPGTCEE